MKRGPLNKVEKHYIDSMFGTMSTTEMAADLKRPEEQVMKYLESKSREVENKPADTKTVATIERTKKKGVSVSDMMGRRLGNDGSVIAVTLTPGASERMDDARGDLRSKMVNQEHIFRPLDPSELKKRTKKHG